ncbi:hypothetical protein FB451DRAFT_1385440 [Mycena latifolia]|nr:hypothetical protein FB451DRAFT_1385440 [Mycena latifolia]
MPWLPALDRRLATPQAHCEIGRPLNWRGGTRVRGRRILPAPRLTSWDALCIPSSFSPGPRDALLLASPQTSLAPRGCACEARARLPANANNFKPHTGFAAAHRRITILLERSTPGTRGPSKSERTNAPPHSLSFTDCAAPRRAPALYQRRRPARTIALRVIDAPLLFARPGSWRVLIRTDCSNADIASSILEEAYSGAYFVHCPRLDAHFLPANMYAHVEAARAALMLGPVHRLRLHRPVRVLANMPFPARLAGALLSENGVVSSRARRVLSVAAFRWER